jgi:hypothetical protein
MSNQLSCLGTISLLLSEKESPPNTIKFSGTQGFQELALYLRDSLNVISGDLTGCITHHHLSLHSDECGCEALEQVSP